MLLYIPLLFLLYQTGLAHKMRLIKSNAIQCPVKSPLTNQHHIVLYESWQNHIFAIDFSPIIPENQYWKTLRRLFFGKNVPAEIRIVYLDNILFDEKDDVVVESWNERRVLDSAKQYHMELERKLLEWPTEMNLYRHNCQHFSRWLLAQ